MALIKCIECGKDISDTVKSCPHCGYIYKEEKKITTGKVVLIVAIMIIVAIILFFGGTYLFFDVLPKVFVDAEVKSFYGNYELVESDLSNLKDTRFENCILKKEITINEKNSFKDGDLVNSIGYGNFESGYGFTKDDKLGIFVLISMDQLFDSCDDNFKLEFDKDKDYLYFVDRYNASYAGVFGFEKVTIKYKLK